MTTSRVGAFTSLLCALAAAGCGSDSAATTSPPPDPFGDYGVFLSLVPPGSADVNTGMIGDDPNSINQLPMYENLVFSDNYPTPGALADEDLAPDYFKDEAFLPETEFENLTSTTDGVHSARIGRDGFGVPHIFGDTREDVMFGTGYATGADRMFLVDVIRHFGRGRMSDFLGPSEGNLVTDIGLGTSGGYSEQELQDQLDLIAARLGVDGPQAQQDVDDFVAGINQYIEDVKTGAPGAEPIPIEYALLNLELRPFTGRDVIAVTTLIFSFFATGGGAEDRQVQLLHGLSTLYPDDPQAACELWRDIRQADDPERPNTTEVRFETQSPPSIDETACPLEPGFAAEFPGAVVFDADSLQRRDLLSVEECVEPALAMPGDVECPNFGEDVVNDPVTSASAARFLAGEPLMSMASLSPTLSGTQVCSLDYASSRGLDAARTRALARVEGVVSALQSDSFPRAMSNAILAGADETESGHPIAVFGPQTGYFSPQIMMEFSQHGGGVHTRGMAFAGMPYVIIGRGIDHAFSATSAGDDIIDIRVLRLCEEGGGEATRDSTSYLYNGVCTPMLQRSDEWTAETNFLTFGIPEPESHPQHSSRARLRAGVRDRDGGRRAGGACDSTFDLLW